MKTKAVLLRKAIYSSAVVDVPEDLGEGDILDMAWRGEFHAEFDHQDDTHIEYEIDEDFDG